MKRLLVTLGSALVLTVPIPAHADPGVDASFIDALNKAGISYKDPAGAVEAGHSTCDLISQGKPGIQVVQLVQQENSGISTVSAAQFTAIAVSAYCPQYMQQADGATSPSPSRGNATATSGGQQ